MKTLIEKSIEIKGIGVLNPKTIFNIENENEKKHFKYKSLTNISGRKLSIHFKYTENDIEVQDKLQMTIIKSEDETEIKDFILTQINSYLA
jgi:hypothetical protein